MVDVLLEKNRGWTLLELMIALGILAIIIQFVMDGAMHWVARSQAKSYMNQLLTDLQFARQMAVTHHASVTVCPIKRADEWICGTDWQNGYILVDGERVIRRGPVIPKKGHLRFNREKILFLSDGSAAGSNGTFVYHQTGLPGSIEIILNVLGRIVWKN